MTQENSSLFKRLPRPVLIVTIICLVLAPILLFNLVEFLRGGEIFNWLWPYVPVTVWKGIALAAVAIAYVAAALLVARWKKARWALLVAIVGIIVLEVMVTWLRYDNPVLELFNRTVSPVVTGPHLIGARVDWQDVDSWHDWTKVMKEYEIITIHMALSPPGLAMWYGGLNQALEWSPGVTEFLYPLLLPNQCHNSNMLNYTHAEWASLWFGILMPLWVALTVFPLYGVARRMVGDPHARYITLMWAIIPTVAMMSPSWNLMYPQLCLWAFWLMLKGIDAGAGRAIPYMLVAGFLISILTFANLSVVPVILLFGFYVLLHWFFNERQQHSFARPVWLGIWFGVGVLSVWGIYYLATGTTFFMILDRAFGKHLNLERPYIPWLWMHFWEWALLGSLPSVGLWLLSFFDWNNPSSIVRRHRPGASVLPYALLATMIVLLLSNTARGETGRVWLFFTPFAMLCAGLYIRRYFEGVRTRHAASNMDVAANAGKHPTPNPSPNSGRGTPPLLVERGLGGEVGEVWGALFIAQVALMLALATTWDTMFAPDIRPTPPPPTAYANPIPQNALFADVFRLTGWGSEVAGNKVTLHLNMQSNRQLTIPYYFAVLPVAPDGSTPVEATVWQPNSTRYPTTCWQPDQLVGDSVDIYLPDDPIPGDWWLSLVAFADKDKPMERLTVTLPDGTQDTQIGLGPVTVGGEN